MNGTQRKERSPQAGPLGRLGHEGGGLDPALKSARGMGFPIGSVVEHLHAMQQTQIRHVHGRDLVIKQGEEEGRAPGEEGGLSLEAVRRRCWLTLRKTDKSINDRTMS